MFFFLFNRTTLQGFVTYLKGALYFVLNKKIHTYYLNYIVYDKLLKPRQSFRITLYIYYYYNIYMCVCVCVRQVVKTPTIISNNPVHLLYIYIYVISKSCNFLLKISWFSLCVECFLRISEQTATCALYIINWLIFITVVESVYSAVRTGSLYKADYVTSLKG